MGAWLLRYDGVDPDGERLRESLCTLGNGYFATRGAAPEATADAVHHPGTYVAGCYDRLTSTVAGRTTTNEDLVNAPNWLPLTFRAGDGEWFGSGSAGLLDHRQELDLRRGVLTRRLRHRDAAGRDTAVEQQRLVSMDDPHLAALRTVIRAENWSGTLEIRSGLDGRVRNDGVARYRGLADAHLVIRSTGTDRDVIWLEAETVTSAVRIAEAARTTVTGAAVIRRETRGEPGRIAHHLTVTLRRGDAVIVEKVVALHTSRDRATDGTLAAARSRAERAPAFAELCERHVLAWDHLWRRARLDVGRSAAQRTVNLHMFHLLQTVSPHTVGLDVGVPARGLHGEAYRGHVFWDELFVLPFLGLRFPDVVRALLLYRWHRLPAAREAAREAGYAGAMYPWQSGGDGRDETPRTHFNPRSGRWLPDNSRLQRHVGLAVAFNIWQYYEATGDLEFLSSHGAEMLLEIARFWADLATFDASSGRYDIRGVMGPDEYHDALPGAAAPGLTNNAYTNVMAAWTLCRALDVLALLPSERRAELLERLGLEPAEIARLEDVSRRLRVPFHADGVISQFEGYEELAEFDWAGYRAKYGDIRRLDRILEAEGDTPNRYKASKQADVLMLFYLLSADELTALLDRLGYRLDRAAIPRTVRYYLGRTSHGSTLSAVVHAWVLARSDRAASWRFFLEALDGDLHDVQGGTTGEGVHLGAMAGTLDLAQRCYTGLEPRGDVLRLNPRLPPGLPGLGMELRYRGHWGIRLDADHRGVRVGLRRSAQPPIRMVVDGGPVTTIPAGRTVWFATSAPAGEHAAGERTAGTG
ncbi:glycoside hydrolase family 65 protein [Actinoallomurus rhizosphaericola]|uniref:glycoside hydrolase family 65 protein n=1 Tax=Actinoallomurus rhizosphaericola TaxID=2952536 RepID=UPI002093B28A|nr:glycosyl hydrolase family 65 protein [Actinoallomurus rhizosphaericola]MCO5995542.1 glycoside hydrolase family 65 protein [Actinoallomurus rhizosphaericola]